jgi:hypothetical protein
MAAVAEKSWQQHPPAYWRFALGLMEKRFGPPPWAPRKRVLPCWPARSQSHGLATETRWRFVRYADDFVLVVRPGQG